MTSMAQEVYELPQPAVRTLSEPGLVLELHGIGFSHYVERARWALRLSGLPFSEVNYLPLAHMFGISKLQKLFKQGPGKATASSKSPSATPVLAVCSADKKPLCLIANSALIIRYAVLRAQALGSTATPALYGPSLAVDSTTDPPTVAGSDDLYKQIADMELRLSGTLGIEVRRVLYHYLLPKASLAGLMFEKNSTGWEQSWSGLIYWMCRLLLPKFLNINEATAARGCQKLLEEFDHLDSLVLKQQQAHLQNQQQQTPSDDKVTKSAAATADAESKETGQAKLPYYLLGPELTAADISLACLGGHLVYAPYQQWFPNHKDWPQELRALAENLSKRPTAKLILDIWKIHGPGTTQNSGDKPKASQQSHL